MTTKMVASFRRSVSFPNNPSKPQKKTFHVRSTSLPSRSHPLISQLKYQIGDLRAWASKSDNKSSAWLCDGLNRLKTLHESLDDLLQLPQTHESLRDRSEWIEKVLDDLLRFVDVYGIFQTLVLALKQDHSAAQVAIRRRDDSNTALYLKALKKLARETGKLISTVGKLSIPSVSPSDADAELAGVISDVNEVTIMVSTALFRGISLSFGLRKLAWKGLKLSRKVSADEEEGIKEFKEVGIENLKKKVITDEEVKKMVLKRMYEMEDCIVGIECGSERVFRSLINTRVSLLNLLTQ